MVAFKLQRSRTLLTASVACAGTVLLTQFSPSYAQENRNVESELLQQVISLPAEGLAAIREAPFSEQFIIPAQNGIEVQAVKDKDFDPDYDGIGFYSLWGSVPEYDVFQASVFYCFRNPSLVGADLETVTLMDGDEVLLTMDQKFVTTVAENVEVSPERYETIQYSDPFYDPFWGGWGRYPYGGNFAPRVTTRTVYFPSVDCSVGGGRFDLASVRDQIPNLPDKTLDVRILFSNGVVETWRLGRGTVRELRNLPIAP